MFPLSMILISILVLLLYSGAFDKNKKNNYYKFKHRKKQLLFSYLF